MRLDNVETGHRWRYKLFFAVIRVMSGHRAPDIMRVLCYRPEFLGRALNAALQHAMRGPSDWSPGERELMAAYVSRQNQCPF